MRSAGPDRLIEEASVAVHFEDRTPTSGGPSRSAVSQGRVKIIEERGSISIVPEEKTTAPASQRGLTVLVRIGRPSGLRERVLLREYAPDRRLRYSLAEKKDCLLFALYTDYRDEPLLLQATVPLHGAAPHHDILVRYSGHVVRMHLDGRLVDEEWPVGALPGEGRGGLLMEERKKGTKEGIAPDGTIEHLYVWDRVLTDEEIDVLHLGPMQPARGDEATDETPSPQYKEAPAGGYVGDCMPFSHDGIYHLYYLFDRRNHRSKFGLGAHQWAHMASKDLLHWEQFPHAIPITDEREGSICTGSVYYHEGTWYGFYATRMLDRSEHLSVATSSDGIHFTKYKSNPIASPQPPYRPGPFRDPFVFRSQSDGLFHMLATAELADSPVARRGGCLAHLISSDLRSWEQREPFLVTGYADQPECSELFEWRGWYYLVFSHFGIAHYRMSRNLFGPWTRPTVDTFDGPQARVMKSASYLNDRRIAVGFLDKGRGYAGCAVFREYLQRGDGTLATCWPAELIPDSGSPLSLGLRPITPTCPPGRTSAAKAGSFTVDAANGFAAVDLGVVPRDLLVRFRATPDAGVLAYGVAFRGTEDLGGALLLEVSPGRRKVGWRRAGDPSWQECEFSAIYEVDALEQRVSVSALALDDVFDVCINEDRTLISRNAAEPAGGDRLFFYCHDGKVAFDSVTIQPILPR